MSTTDPTKPDRKRTRPAGITILVVDDNPDLRWATTRILQTAGYHVLTGGSAAEALSLTRRHRPALLLLDVVLGDGSGIDVARQVKTDPILANVLVIMLSGMRISPDQQAEGMDDGLADGYIIRPFNHHELLARIDAFARLQQSQEALCAKNTELECVKDILRASEEQLAATLRSIDDGVISTDAAGSVTGLNMVAEALTRWSTAEAKGRPLAEVFRIINTETRAAAEVQVTRALGSGEIVNLPHHTALIGRDGSECPIATSCAPIRDTGRQIIGAVLVFRDMTAAYAAAAEKTALEAQNLQLQKAESLGRMAGAIAHHFNNQLQAVIGNLEMAKEEQQRGACSAESVSDAMSAARQAATVSRLMLTYLGQTPVKLEPLDLAELCRQNLPIFRVAMPHKLTLEADLSAPGPAIRANANQMQQLLTNLVTNAWEAMGCDQGKIRLTVTTVSSADIPTAPRRPLVWQPQDRSYVCLEVTDAGCGIAPEAIDTIFDPFFSTKFPGRGLGLSVVLGILRAHDGVITVKSELGRGSIFRAFFPELPHPAAVAARTLD